MTRPSNETIDWREVRLAVFDLDGTLYRQAPLRLIMAAQLLGHAIASRSLRTARTVRAFRQVREMLGEEQTPDFLNAQYDETAQRCHTAPAEVREIVEEWMERRPLAHLKQFRTRGAAQLFADFKQAGVLVGVWSDYPVTDKLNALDLKADFIISAGDAVINRLKPHPAGLNRIMSLAQAAPDETVMIGDRLDRDGVAAAAAGCRYIHCGAAGATRGLSCRNFKAPLFGSIAAR